jgi:hypothetical protein
MGRDDVLAGQIKDHQLDAVAQLSALWSWEGPDNRWGDCGTWQEIPHDASCR